MWYILIQTDCAYSLAQSTTENDKMPNLHSKHLLNITTGHLGFTVYHKSYARGCYGSAWVPLLMIFITLPCHITKTTTQMCIQHIILLSVSFMLGAEGKSHCFLPFISTLLIPSWQHNQLSAVVHTCIHFQLRSKIYRKILNITHIQKYELWTDILSWTLKWI